MNIPFVSLPKEYSMFKKNIIKKILVASVTIVSMWFTGIIIYVIGILWNSGRFDDLAQGLVIAGSLFTLNSVLASYGCYALWKRVSA